MIRFVSTGMLDCGLMDFGLPILGARHSSFLTGQSYLFLGKVLKGKVHFKAFPSPFSNHG